jgi:hypothetical protein
MTRECSDCQLCCKLLPVVPLEKTAGERCRYQKFSTGCTVYNTRRMPRECSLWNCRWLVNDDTGDLPRPDRSHVVIDVMPDFVTVRDNETGKTFPLEVVQVWCDPKHRDAHRDPALRDYLFRRAQEGKAALIRYGSREAFTLLAPPLNADGEWHKVSGESDHRTHSAAAIIQTLGSRS